MAKLDVTQSLKAKAGNAVTACSDFISYTNSLEKELLKANSYASIVSVKAEKEEKLADALEKKNKTQGESLSAEKAEHEEWLKNTTREIERDKKQAREFRDQQKTLLEVAEKTNADAEALKSSNSKLNEQLKIKVLKVAELVRN